MLKRQGFTLPEILVSIAIVSILAAILVSTLLNSRTKAYDTATESCLKEVSTRQMAYATHDPFKYDTSLSTAAVSVCNNVAFTANTSVSADAFTYEAKHNLGANTYTVSAGTGITRVGASTGGTSGGGSSGNNGNGNGNSGNNGNGNSGNNGNGGSKKP